VNHYQIERFQKSPDLFQAILGLRGKNAVGGGFRFPAHDPEDRNAIGMHVYANRGFSPRLFPDLNPFGSSFTRKEINFQFGEVVLKFFFEFRQRSDLSSHIFKGQLRGFAKLMTEVDHNQASACSVGKPESRQSEIHHSTRWRSTIPLALASESIEN
jgi:hypothetical protein